MHRKKDKPRKFKSFQELRKAQSEERLFEPSNLVDRKPGHEPKGIASKTTPKIDELIEGA